MVDNELHTNVEINTEYGYMLENTEDAITHGVFRDTLHVGHMTHKDVKQNKYTTQHVLDTTINKHRSDK